MINISEIDVKLISYEKKLGNSRLDFNISGESINNVIMNTLRRTILSDIPIYALSDTKIYKNTSTFTEDDLTNRLIMLPIWGIENNIDFIETPIIPVENIASTPTFDYEDIDVNNDMEFKLSTFKEFTIYLNYKNKKSHELISITTDHLLFYYDQKKIESPYHTPIQLLKLNPDEEIILSAKSKLGSDDLNDHPKFCATAATAFKHITDNNYDFFLESRGQLTEKRILIVAIINIKRRMIKLLDLMKENNSLNELSEGILIVDNEDETLGNLIAYGLQLHKDISSASCNRPQPLMKSIKFDFKLKKNNIINITNDVILYFNELFEKISKEINKLK